MDLIPDRVPYAGFSFINSKRNLLKISAGVEPPPAIRTGTVIAGLMYDGGVILGADTRKTVGKCSIKDTNFTNVHCLADTIYCCGTGKAADIEVYASMTASQIKLLQLNTEHAVPANAAITVLSKYVQRQCSATELAYIAAGVDGHGVHLCSIAPQGYVSEEKFMASGRGRQQAITLLEQRWHSQLTQEEAKILMLDVIEAGLTYDLLSSCSIDLCVIGSNGVIVKERQEISMKEKAALKNYYPPGSIEVTVLEEGIATFNDFKREVEAPLKKDAPSTSGRRRKKKLK